MPAEVVVDTFVLQATNAPIAKTPRRGSLFVKRLDLLNRIARGEITVLISKRLISEYERQVPEPRNDYVETFLALIADPRRAIFNWHTPWSGGIRDKARKCRFPAEDDHVLRTAIRPGSTTILAEEKRMLDADACIYRGFRVHIKRPY